MSDRGIRHLLLEDNLSLLVQLGARREIRTLASFDDQRVEGRIAPLREIAAMHRFATEQGAEPVVRIAVVARPAIQNRVMFAALLRAPVVLTPFVTDDLRAHADGRPV